MTTKITPRASFTILNKQMIQINTAERLAAKAFFGLFYEATTNCDRTQSHIINAILTSFALPVRESIAFGSYRTDRATKERGLCDKNLRQYFPVQTSHSVNKCLLLAKVKNKAIVFANDRQLLI